MNQLKKADSLTNQIKQRDAILTNAKETNILNENCFVCYKPDHTFKECSHRVSRINALNDDANEFNRFDSNLNSNLKN